MTSARKRQALTVGLAALALSGIAAGGMVVARSIAGDDPGRAGGPAATPTAASPSLNVDGSIATPTTEPSFVATDEPRPSDAGIDVVLTYAGFDPATGTVQANGYVAGVYEDGGTCTLTLTNGGDLVTATSEGFADATTTSCGLIATGADVPAGTWKAVLSYSSAESDALEVSVP